MKLIVFGILTFFSLGDSFCLNSLRTILPMSRVSPNTPIQRELHPITRTNRMHLYEIILDNIGSQDQAEIVAWGSTHTITGQTGKDVLAEINDQAISLRAFLQINEAVLLTFNPNETIYMEAFAAIRRRGYTFVEIYYDSLTNRILGMKELLPFGYIHYDE